MRNISCRLSLCLGHLALFSCGGAEPGDSPAPPAMFEAPPGRALEPPNQEAAPAAPLEPAQPVTPSPAEVGPIPDLVGLDGSGAELEGAAPALAPAEMMPPDDAAVPQMPGVEPVASHASPEARNLLNYLYATYGKRMLSGQMESTWMQGGAEYEMNYVEDTTGKLPAIRGLDFIQYNGVAQRAIDWWGRGGISNIRWHWGAPTHGEGYEASQEAVDLERVLTAGTPEHTAMLASLDRTAAELTKLKDARVPVLWTPFHELNGNWFWWGKGSPQQFVRLWRFMFDYFDGEKGLDNLIWVLGYTGQPNVGWYPGTEYVDIAGADSYARTAAPQLDMFNAVRSIVGNAMPVSYHECGIVPDPSLARQQGATWSWFMTWHTSWLTDENTTEHLNAVYHDDFVVTLDQVPDLR